MCEAMERLGLMLAVGGATLWFMLVLFRVIGLRNLATLFAEVVFSAAMTVGYVVMGVSGVMGSESGLDAAIGIIIGLGPTAIHLGLTTLMTGYFLSASGERTGDRVWIAGKRMVVAGIAATGVIIAFAFTTFYVRGGR